MKPYIMGVFKDDYNADRYTILVDSCAKPPYGIGESDFKNRKLYYEALEQCRPFTFIPWDYYGD